MLPRTSLDVDSAAARGTRWNDYQHHATYLQALASEVKAAGLFDELVQHLAPPLRAAWTTPSLQRWWPGAVLGEANEVIHAMHGPAVLEGIVERALNNSMVRAVQSLVGVLFSLGGASPATVFAKSGLVIGVGVRGLSFGWERKGPTHGTWQVRYPSAVVPSFVAHYRPVVRFVGNLCRVPCTVVHDELQQAGRRLSFDVDWS